MILVIDASALLPLLLLDPTAAELEERLFDPAVQLCAPHLVDVEVAHTLRREVARSRVTASAAEEGLRDLVHLLPIERFEHPTLLPRVWALRSNLSAYHATYVALAERLDAPLLTRDAKLAGAPGHNARIELV